MLETEMVDVFEFDEFMQSEVFDSNPTCQNSRAFLTELNKNPELVNVNIDELSDGILPEESVEGKKVEHYAAAFAFGLLWSQAMGARAYPDSNFSFPFGFSYLRQIPTALENEHLQNFFKRLGQYVDGKSYEIRHPEELAEDGQMNIRISKCYSIELIATVYAGLNWESEDVDELTFY